MWGFWWTKWHWGRFSPNAPVSPANESTDWFAPIMVHTDHYPSSGTGIIGEIVADVPGGSNLTLPKEIKKILANEMSSGKRHSTFKY
jgi:hypothetical protein